MSAKVLYIAGSGRTGTTFLSLVLSQHPGTQNVGQVRDLHQAVDEGDVCTCGHKVADCPYWQPVRAEVEAAYGAGALTALSGDAATFRKDTKDSAEWLTQAGRARIKTAHAGYLTRLGALYLAASRQAQGRMLVDSSKSVDLVFALSLIPEIDLHLLNLVRDPRAVATSWSKVLKRKEKQQTRADAWTNRQKACDILRQNAPDRFKLLRYEDLTATPRTNIGELQDWAGLPRDLGSFTSDETTRISWERAHLFRPSNETVLREHRDSFVIKAADAWKDPANASAHQMAEAAAFPFAAQLGYVKGVIS